jgi:SOS-response transcriptional repressor LexA
MLLTEVPAIQMAEMKTFGQRLTALMDERHLAIRQLAETAGISPDAVRRARLMKKYDELRPTTFQALAAGFNMTVEDLHRILVDGKSPKDLALGSDYDPMRDPSYTRDQYLPVIGRVAAGRPTDSELQITETAALHDRTVPASLYYSPVEWPAVIMAEGDSMEPLIVNGDLVIIARRFRRQPRTGDIVAISFVQEETHTIKHLEIKSDGNWLLIPLNKKHPERTVDPRTQIKSAAVVVGWYHAHIRPESRKK